jgi:hypothetical protein
MYMKNIKTLETEFWNATEARTGIMKIVVSKNTVDYILYASNIATLDRQTNVLTLRDCGYMTQTTKFVLNAILHKLPYYIHADRYRWIISSQSVQDRFLWQDENVFINGELANGVLQKTNKTLSALAKKRWNTINTELTPNKITSFTTLSGVIYGVLKHSKGLKQQTIFIKEEHGDILWAECDIARQTLLHAVQTGYITPPQEWKVFDTAVIDICTDVNINKFPKSIRNIIAARVAMS